MPCVSFHGGTFYLISDIPNFFKEGEFNNEYNNEYNKGPICGSRVIWFGINIIE